MRRQGGRESASGKCHRFMDSVAICVKGLAGALGLPANSLDTDGDVLERGAPQAPL